jgi:hypothetical protein
MAEQMGPAGRVTPRNSIMRNDLVPGAVFPDCQLPDHTCTPRRLSELQGADPLS